MRGSGHFKTSYQYDMAIIDTPFRRFWLGMLLLSAVAFPLIAPGYFVHLANLGLLASTGAIMLNLLTGCTGLISLGHAAFLCSGAFTAAILATHFNSPFWVNVPMAGLVGAVLGCLVGLPALRLRAVYLILSTVAIHFTITLAAALIQSRGGYVSGYQVPTAVILGLKLDNSLKWYFFLLIVTGIVTVFAVNLLRTRVGRAWMAVRDRDVAASALGVNVASYKILAFTFTSSVTAMAGALGAYYMNYAAVEEYHMELGINYIIMIIIGGLGSIIGSFIGAFFVTLLPYVLSGLFNSTEILGKSEGLFALQFASSGFLIALFVIIEPEGFMGIWRRVQKYFALWPLKYR
jgi:branched-chain amino acid transport system permease protein